MDLLCLPKQGWCQVQGWVDVVTLPEQEQCRAVPAWLGLEQMGHCGHGGGAEGGSWGPREA